MGTFELEDVIELLDRHQQRATYSAVAAVTGGSAQSQMSVYPHAPRYSWVVSKATLLPTGYAPEEMHPALRTKSFVLLTESELRTWLTKRGGAAYAG